MSSFLMVYFDVGVVATVCILTSLNSLEKPVNAINSHVFFIVHFLHQFGLIFCDLT